MCGRYTSTSTVTDLAEIFDVDEVRTEPLPLRFNVAPSLPVYSVALRRDGRRALGAMRWGLIPSWAKAASIGNRMINARAETVETKPAYRAALARRRCLLPADAFYEWQRRTRSDGRAAAKLAYAIRRRDGAPMALAGLWEVWRDPEAGDAEPVRSCAIVTTEANAVMAPIHDRMPVVVAPEDWSIWLDPATPITAARALLRPAPPDWLEAYAVSSLVNNVANEGPELLQPLPPPPAPGNLLDPGRVAESAQN